MPHHYLEGLNGEWKVIRETPSSTKFICINEGKRCAVDIHYTSSKLVTVNLMIEGTDEDLSKNFLNPLMDDLEHIILKHADYAVIDYTLGACSSISEGNYSVSEKYRSVIKRKFHS